MMGQPKIWLLPEILPNRSMLNRGASTLIRCSDRYDVSDSRQPVH